MTSDADDVSQDPKPVDVCIVGGGPAGLSAALVLARARRTVVVLDEQRPRNAASRALHGFLSRDGIAPAELRRIGREELLRYPSASWRASRAEDATRDGERFVVTASDRRRFCSRKLILASGVIDELPSIDGLQPLYGRSVFHCPYCDGWEVRDQPLGVYGGDVARAAELALELTVWSRDLVLFTGGAPLAPEVEERLGRNEVRIERRGAARLDGRDGILERVVFADGSSMGRRALFLLPGRRQATDLARRLGCELFDERGCKPDHLGRTNVRGLYVIGDASRDVLQVAVAVGEGSEAAIAVNTELLKEELR